MWLAGRVPRRGGPARRPAARRRRFHRRPAADALQNATYNGILPEQPITLTDGSATYEEEGPGTPFVQLVDQLTAAGDLDGDGVEDAVGLLVDYTTGSADFVYLAALLSTQAGPVDADPNRRPHPGESPHHRGR